MDHPNVNQDASALGHSAELSAQLLSVAGLAQKAK